MKVVSVAAASALETLENRTLMSATTAFSNSAWMSNGLLTIRGSSSVGSHLTAYVVDNGTAIDASADAGHAITVPLSSVKQIQVIAGNGPNYIYLDQGISVPVSVFGGNGNDTIRGGAGNNYIYEGNGNDWISPRGNTNYISVGNGNDTILASGQNDTIIAGNGNDSINGGSANDSIVAGNGNDSILGGAGNDTIVAGTGKDSIASGKGNNRLTVANGPSIIYPGTGSNYISLAGPLPTVKFSSGANTIVRAGSAPVTTGSSGGSSSSSSSSSNSGSTTTSGTTPTATPAASSGAPSGATNWADSFASVGSGSAPRAVLELLIPDPVVGLAVVGRALDSSLGSGSPIDADYEWNFGDPNSQWNTLPGFNASHVYTQPGNYTVTLTVTNDLHQSSTVSRNITIWPDNRRQIYVNNQTGNDNNNGSSPNQAVATAARAEALLGNNTEVLFACGQEFTLGFSFKLNYYNVLVGSYGSGAKPIINSTEEGTGAVIFTTNSKSAQGVTIENLTMTTLNGTEPTSTKMPMAVMAGGYDLSVLNCTFYYVEYDINASPGPVGLTAIGNDSPINGGLQGYFLWAQGTDITALGNYVNSTVHEHIVRTSTATEMLFDGNDFNNFDGKGCIEIHEGSWAWVQGNTVDGGDIRVGPLGLWGEPVTVGTSTCVIQGNYVENSDISVRPGAHDISIRDNVIERNGSNMIDLLGEDGLGRQSSDIRILNNTGISDSATGQFLVVENHVDGILLENNLMVAPNLATGGNLTAPVYVTEANLSSFTYINGNVWQQPKTIYKYAQGGINFVATSYSINGYLTPSAWNAEPQVGTDYFSNTLLSGFTPVGGIAMQAGAAVQGVFFDINGKALPQAGIWTAGAVQG
jgi:PKD repeat protein